MYSKRFEKETFKNDVKENVRTLYRKEIEEATPQQIFQAVSYAVKEAIVDDWLATQKTYEKEDPKTVYYMSMEFLMGRALGNNLINMVVLDVLQLASWIHLHLLDTQLTAVESVTATVCSNRRSKMAIR